MRLWEKGLPLDRLVHRFTVGDDPELDQEILEYDILGSLAHAAMLCRIGVLTEEELAQVQGAMQEMASLHERGKIAIEPEEEDCHTVIEQFLTERLGEVGKKIHTGRSRNDQVIVALRLFVRERLLDLVEATGGLVEALLERGAEGFSVPLPGYTHMRQAMPSTAGHLLSAWAEGLLRDLELVGGALSFLQHNPLGSASGYGVPLPLERELVAELLGMEGLDRNALYVQNTRGKAESIVLAALAQIQLDLSRMSMDLILFSSEEFAFLALPEALTTGSSIMPQKRNPDVLELVRGTVARVQARYNEVFQVISHLPSGYQRDLQLTKAPLLEGLQMVSSSVVVMARVIEGVVFQKEKCLAGFHPGIFATDRALQRVQREGIPFREAYRLAQESPDEEPVDVEQLLALRTHAGAPGDDDLSFYRALYQEVLAGFAPFRQGAQQARRLLQEPLVALLARLA